MPSFFVPTPEDLTAQESPPPGICHPRQKNANARGGGGGWGQVELTDALMVCGSTPTEGTVFLFWGVVLLLSSFLSLV